MLQSRTLIMGILSQILLILVINDAFGQSPLTIMPETWSVASQFVGQTDNQAVPFTESWDMGSFTYHNWTFSTTNSNWSIDTSYGNPAPCADFFWIPLQVNYNQVMFSDTLDATNWTCAKTWLDFDLKLVGYNNTGSESFAVEANINGAWKPLAQFKNWGTTSWESIHLKIDSVQGTKFQIRFVILGTNSANVLHWYLDNIRVYNKCSPPENLLAQYIHWSQKIYLQWQPPNCNTPPTGNFSWLMYDDGAAELGFGIPPGEEELLGNYFPVAPFSSGRIKEVKLYFFDDYSGSVEQLKIVFFDHNRTLIDSSASFTPIPGSWTSVPVNNIPYSGPFYCMVRFNTQLFQCFIGADQNGPNAFQDLSWYRDTTGAWQLLSGLGSPPSVFLLRTKVEIISDDAQNSDSSLLAGYNVYRSSDYGLPPYTLRNPVPLTDLNFLDDPPQNIWANAYLYYYITTVFRNSSDSTFQCEAISDTTRVSTFITIENGVDLPSIKVYQSNQMIQISSTVPMISLTAYDLTGRSVLGVDRIMDRLIRLDCRSLVRGFYIFKVNTISGPRFEKVLIP